jgi:hypothetical protein
LEFAIASEAHSAVRLIIKDPVFTPAAHIRRQTTLGRIITISIGRQLEAYEPVTEFSLHTDRRTGGYVAL